METEITFILNNQVIRTKINPATVLLDFIRKNKKLTGTKEVCKEGDCGACAVLLGELTNRQINYKVINSCLFPIEKVKGKHVVTIEGLNQDELTPIQSAFVHEGASQCGFCTPGFIISFTAYLLNAKIYNTDKAINAISGNICRCTGYQSIKRSLENVLEKDVTISLELLIEKSIIPQYFTEILQKLKNISINRDENQSVSSVQIISGGTDLFVQKPNVLQNTTIVITENIIKPNIEIRNNQLIISGSATVSDLSTFLKNNNINLNLNKLFQLFASQPIRNSATLAGNIINASPIADLTITLLALNAELSLQNENGEIRKVALKDFYAGYKTLNKQIDEIITEISFSIPSSKSLFNFEKVSKRTHLDIATVNTAISININENKIISASISAGGVSPIPLFLENTSAFLTNSELSTKLIDEAIAIAQKEISPISDIRGSSEYKRLLLSQLIKAHFIQLFPQFSEELIQC